MSERRIPWGPVLGGGALLLTFALVGGYVWALRGPVHAYYQAEYAPAPLTPAELGAPPPAHRLVDVPWYSEALASDASVALRMLLAEQGQEVPRATLDFLTGTTWGASPIPGRTGFLPGQDPESGLRRAAPQLGFSRRYLTTDDQAQFLLAVRTLLSRGLAVRVVVDRAQLLERSGLEVHSEVLVGYDAKGFEYYEPACTELKRCEPGEKPPGSPGLTMTTGRLVLAMESVSLALLYPWKYQLLVLVPEGTRTLQLDQTLRSNAQALVGHTGDGPAIGSVLVERTAVALENHGDGVISEELLRGLELATAARADDAQALEALFPGSAGAEKAASHLEEASRAYGRATQAITAKELVRAVQALHEGAAADRAAGEALILEL